MLLLVNLGSRRFPRWLSGKEAACQTRDTADRGSILWSRQWQPTPVFLPGESHGQRTLGGYSPWGHTEPDDRARPHWQLDRDTEWLVESYQCQPLPSCLEHSIIFISSKWSRTFRQVYKIILFLQSGNAPLLSATPWTVAHQPPLPMGFSRPEFWSGLPCLPPGDLPDPGIEPASPTLSADASLLSHWGS